MIIFAAGFALLLHVMFWGAGLANLATPRAWRRFWPVFVPLCGFALQAAAVWVGSSLEIGGTDLLAWPAEVVPLVLLVLAVRRRSARAWAADWGRFGLVWIIVAGALVLLLLPVAIASLESTGVTVGGSNAVDAAPGAHALTAFAGSSRSAIDPFTSAALIAFNGSILHWSPSALTIVFVAVIIATSVPIVFWIGRSLFGYSPIACLVIASVYAISPITWYTLTRASPAPLLAAQAIAIINWAAVVLWQGRLVRSRALSLLALLVVAFSVILGTYHFLVFVAFLPAATFVATRAIATSAWQRLACWAAALLTPVVVAGAFFGSRVAAMFGDLRVLRAHDLGSYIPPLGPEGWLGVVRGPGLEPWPFLVRWPIAVVCVAALGWAIVEASRRKLRTWLLSCVLAPVLAAYAFLEFRALQGHAGASHDAFQLFAILYPLLLPAFCWWITLRWSGHLTRWLAVAALAALLILGNLVACAMSAWAVAHLPRRLDTAFRPALNRSGDRSGDGMPRRAGPPYPRST